VVEGWLIRGVGFFEVSLSKHRSDGYFCPSTLRDERRQYVASRANQRERERKRRYYNSTLGGNICNR